MSARLHVLQHISCEPPGAYEDELLSRGGSLVRVMVLEQISRREDEMTGLARRLFAAWVRQVVPVGAGVRG
jgi:hypothetical protein